MGGMVKKEDEECFDVEVERMVLMREMAVFSESAEK
jgi:hypothetical protein